MQFGGNGWFSSVPMNCSDCKLTSSSISGIKSCLLIHSLIVTVSSLVVAGPNPERSKNRNVGFMAFSTTSLMYIGSSCPFVCSVKKVSAVLLSMTFSSFFCRKSGLAPLQFVLLLRNFGGRRSPDDCAWWSCGSRRASSFWGVLLRAASSIVLPRGRERVRFRRYIPCRCRNFRFCGKSNGRDGSEAILSNLERS